MIHDLGKLVNQLLDIVRKQLEKENLYQRKSLSVEAPPLIKWRSEYNRNPSAFLDHSPAEVAR